MKHNSSLLALAALSTLFCEAPSIGGAQPSAKQEMASVRYLVGTWHCAHTVGTFSGTYTTTYADILDSGWLKQVYEFPAGQLAKVPVRAEYFMGYDENRHGWVRFGAMSNGQYFAIRMTDTPRGWSWKYVTFFNRRRPESPGVDATFTKKSNTEYAVDGPTYRENGTGATVTEHHVCAKVSASSNTR